MLASFIGTTGASILFIRPLLRTNSQREHTAHLVPFFILAVANAGGLLTPLGDLVAGITPLKLAAISAGCVVMGTTTYIGNGPNLMVKTIAEQGGYTLPGFGRFALFAFAAMLPAHLVMTTVFAIMER